VLTGEPQLVAGANIALLIGAGHGDALTGLMGGGLGWSSDQR
jgi:hypothetical protein